MVILRNGNTPPRRTEFRWRFNLVPSFVNPTTYRSTDIKNGGVDGVHFLVRLVEVVDRRNLNNGLLAG